MPDPIRLLIVEDDPGLQKQLKWAFTEDHEMQFASTRQEALVAAKRFQPQVVLQDLGLPPDADGVEEGFACIAALHEMQPDSKIVVMTGREGREHALRAVREGAFDFCQKPTDLDVLRVILGRAARIHDLEAENRRLRDVNQTAALPGVIATSDAMLKVTTMIRKLAPTQSTVLLLGESGTGKERLASALHQLSARASKPMVALNCAAIPENLLESELFGYERGAFTGAVKQTIGKIEGASGGTLFLDEIGDMPMPLQAKMLRFLQERVIERLGGRTPIPVDVRIVAATNIDLDAAVIRGTFRQDLLYRISEVAVAIPPLRDRAGDAAVIAQVFLRAATERHGRSANLRFSNAAVQALQAHGWPGNVRELENRVNRAAILVEGDIVTATDLGFSEPEVPADELPLFNLREVRNRAEAEAVRRALTIAEGNVSRAADLLGVSRPTLYDLMERARVAS